MKWKSEINKSLFSIEVCMLRELIKLHFQKIQLSIVGLIKAYFYCFHTSFMSLVCCWKHGESSQVVVFAGAFRVHVPRTKTFDLLSGNYYTNCLGRKYEYFYEYFPARHLVYCLLFESLMTNTQNWTWYKAKNNNTLSD